VRLPSAVLLLLLLLSLQVTVSECYSRLVMSRFDSSGLPLLLLLLQGRLITAMREAKGGFFSRLGLQLSSAHKKHFKVGGGLPNSQFAMGSAQYCCGFLRAVT